MWTLQSPSIQGASLWELCEAPIERALLLGLCEAPLYKALCKDPIEKRLCKTLRGFIHTYAHFSLFYLHILEVLHYGGLVKPLYLGASPWGLHNAPP